MHTSPVPEQGKATNVRAACCPTHVRFCGKVKRGRRCNESYKLAALRRYYSAFHNVTAMARPRCALLPASWMVNVCHHMGGAACVFCACLGATARRV